MRSQKCPTERPLVQTTYRLKPTSTSLEIILSTSTISLYHFGEDPDDFHKAKLCILYKKGDRLNANNYRPICLLDVASKVISLIIANRCQSVLQTHGIDEQNGFLNKKGCTNATFALKMALQTWKEFKLDS